MKKAHKEKSQLPYIRDNKKKQRWELIIQGWGPIAFESYKGKNKQKAFDDFKVIMQGYKLIPA